MRKRRGWSLVEAAAYVVILSLAVAFMYPSLQNRVEEGYLSQVSNDITAILNMATDYASTHTVPPASLADIGLPAEKWNNPWGFPYQLSFAENVASVSTRLKAGLSMPASMLPSRAVSADGVVTATKPIEGGPHLQMVYEKENLYSE
jgi:type II secretory pathway pseudopilin PulG